MYYKVTLILLMYGILEGHARYKNEYLSWWTLPGDCLDCGFSRQICGLENPGCRKNECRVACLDPISWLEYKNGRPVERQGTCDPTRQVNEFYCMDDMQCQETEICCHTETGSYCN